MSREIMAGTLMLAVLLGVFFFVHTQKLNQPTTTNGLQLIAKFNKADGIVNGSKVRISGLDVGKVTNITLDPYYRVILTLSFNRDIDLPEDTAAVIETEGLVGNKYIELTVGGDEETLTDNATLLYTQDALLLDELLERFLGWMRTKKGVQLNDGE